MSTLNSALALECGHWHHHSVTGCVVLSLEPLGSAVGLALPFPAAIPHTLGLVASGPQHAWKAPGARWHPALQP